MNRCRQLILLTAACMTLGAGGVAHANSISPYVYFWPGVVTITLAYAFPASVLASFIERPFYSAAGLPSRALLLSLRANFLSTLVGIILMPIGYPALYIFGPLWSIAAFGVSCAVEGFYVRRFATNFRWSRVIGGNAASSFVLIILPPIAVAIDARNPSLTYDIQPYESFLLWSTLVASVAIFIGSFARRIPTQTPGANESDNNVATQVAPEHSAIQKVEADSVI